MRLRSGCPRGISAQQRPETGHSSADTSASVSPTTRPSVGRKKVREIRKEKTRGGEAILVSYKHVPATLVATEPQRYAEIFTHESHTSKRGSCQFIHFQMQVRL